MSFCHNGCAPALTYPAPSPSLLCCAPLCSIIPKPAPEPPKPKAPKPKELPSKAYDHTEKHAIAFALCQDHTAVLQWILTK
eukprot:1149633-Pelagomonas_calceolata.AAC.3